MYKPDSCVFRSVRTRNRACAVLRKFRRTILPDSSRRMYGHTLGLSTPQAGLDREWSHDASSSSQRLSNSVQPLNCKSRLHEDVAWDTFPRIMKQLCKLCAEWGPFRLHTYNSITFFPVHSTYLFVLKRFLASFDWNYVKWRFTPSKITHQWLDNR